MNFRTKVAMVRPIGLRSTAVTSTNARPPTGAKAGGGATGSDVCGPGRPTNRAAVPPITPNAASPIGVIGRVSPCARLAQTNARSAPSRDGGTG